MFQNDKQKIGEIKMENPKLNDLVIAMKKGRALYDIQSKRKIGSHVIDAYYLAPYGKPGCSSYDGIYLGDIYSYVYKKNRSEEEKKWPQPINRSYNKKDRKVDDIETLLDVTNPALRTLLVGLGDAASENGDKSMATSAYGAAGSIESKHAQRYLAKTDSVIKEREFAYRERKKIVDEKEAKEKAERNALYESWKHPRSNARGQTEYHTSYGWFTDEQIENLSKSNYFNQ